jgi:alpha-N-acetylglucosaminidase
MPRLLLALALVLPAARAAHDPVAAVSGLITRLLGADALARFSLSAIAPDAATGLDVFEAGADGPRVALRGSSGTALAVALNNYLKYDVNASIAWGRAQSGVRAPLPAVLPLPAPARTVMPMKWRYAWNVCTAGYSFVWYDYPQWQFMIDWLALQGVNLPLAFNGQERVFFDAYKALGLTDAELWAYFSGPAFLPWNRTLMRHNAAPARCARNCDPDDPNTQNARPATLNQQAWATCRPSAHLTHRSRGSTMAGSTLSLRYRCRSLPRCAHME